MSLAAPSSQKIDATAFRIGLAVARFNKRLVDALLQQVRAHLRAAGVKEKKLAVVRVPGSNELPYAAQLLARRTKFDALIALGVLIRGDTLHFEFIAQAAAHALQRVALDEHTPIINGIIVAETRAQAETRCLGKINRGAEFARAALETAALKRKFSR
ncbi:MAG: 6,7-dimethyl-8-ribityllumazine synthase [Verrucomicrobiota bacterium]|nr:6,7-dimethyl-8-ribityllumazine synthase [Verrucomicrobiota bacterium]